MNRRTCLPRCGALFSALLVVVLVVGVAHAGAETANGAAFLSGDWLFVDASHPGSCGFPAAHGEQIAFEFSRTGGRALFFEAADLFSVFGGVEVRSEGDLLVLSARTRLGERREFARIRQKGANDAESLSRDGSVTQLRRCPASGASPTTAISNSILLALSPPITGGQGFPEILPGEKPADVCAGALDHGRPRAWAQFELIGPGFFWTFFGGRSSVQDYSSILSARQLGDNEIILSLRNWATSSTIDLDVHVWPDRIEIPKLSAVFARCSPDQPGSPGMHRL